MVEGNNANLAHERDIIVHTHLGHKHTIKHYYGCYDPLQYPLLFLKGDVGWHQNILEKNSTKTSNDVPQTHYDSQVGNFESVEDIMNREQRCVDGCGNQKVSCRQYYCYKLKISDYQSILLYSGCLLQQYVIDMYSKLETTMELHFSRVSPLNDETHFYW